MLLMPSMSKEHFFGLSIKIFDCNQPKTLVLMQQLAKKKGGQVDRISVVTFAIKIFDRNQPQNLSCKSTSKEKKRCIGRPNFDRHQSKTLIIVQQSKKKKKKTIGHVNRISIAIRMNKTFDCHWSNPSSQCNN